MFTRRSSSYEVLLSLKRLPHVIVASVRCTTVVTLSREASIRTNTHSLRFYLLTFERDCSHLNANAHARARYTLSPRDNVGGNPAVFLRLREVTVAKTRYRGDELILIRLTLIREVHFLKKKRQTGKRIYFFSLRVSYEEKKILYYTYINIFIFI